LDFLFSIIQNFKRLKMAKILFHIGLPKTATTTLQLHLFHNLSLNGSINYIGRYKDPGMDGYYNKAQKILASLFTNSDEMYYENITMYRKILNERLLDKETLNVFSEEMFTISYDSEDESLHILRNIERLKLLLEEHDVTILFSLRNQMDMFYAYYVENYSIRYYKDTRFNNIDKYISCFKNSEYIENFMMYDYLKIINKLESNFKNIEILVFEDLKNNPNKYQQKLADILKTDLRVIQKYLSSKHENNKIKLAEGYKPNSITLSKKVNDIINKSFLKKTRSFFSSSKFLKVIYNYFLDKLDSVKLQENTIAYLNEKDKKYILDFYSIDNQKINEKYNINLTKEYINKEKYECAKQR